MVISYLGIGSNLGNRHSYIRTAINKINALKDTKVLKVSSLIETYPVGGPAGQRKFLNGAIRIKTSLPSATLLKKLKKIERELGRKKTVRNGPRKIDLDILLYGNQIIYTKQLKVPHPRMFERKFVIEPLDQVIEKGLYF